MWLSLATVLLQPAHLCITSAEAEFYTKITQCINLDDRLKKNPQKHQNKDQNNCRRVWTLYKSCASSSTLIRAARGITPTVL